MKKRRVRINDKIGTVLPASWGNDWIYVGNCHREDFFNFIRFDHDKLYRETLTDQQEEILLKWFPTISLRDASEPAPVASDARPKFQGYVTKGDAQQITAGVNKFAVMVHVRKSDVYSEPVTLSPSDPNKVD